MPQLSIPLTTAPNGPFILSVIAEPPGAFAVVESRKRPDAEFWSTVAHLTPPQRGKRFDRSTKLGRVLHRLHADDAVSLVLINLPDCYTSIAAFRRHPNPDVLHLLRTLARIQVPSALTVTHLWRPDVDDPCASGDLLHDLTAYLPDGLKVSPHAEAQCIEALLLGVSAAADVPDGGIGLIINPS